MIGLFDKFKNKCENKIIYGEFMENISSIKLHLIKREKITKKSFELNYFFIFFLSGDEHHHSLLLLL